jgi:hypothetical protein
VVRRQWRDGTRQLGIDVYWSGNKKDSDATVAAKARRIVDYAISLNANSITLTFPFYTYGINSDLVYANPATTPSARHVGIFLAAAAASHMRVTLRPTLDEKVLVAQNGEAWRGSIEPMNTAAWFRSYQNLLMPFAEVAQAGHAATFVVGTELASLATAPEWPVLLEAVGSVYKGQLLYDVNFEEFQNHDTALPLSTYGVDAYPRFNLPDSASVSALTDAWNGWLGNHSPTLLHKVVLQEVGIDAVAQSYPDPGAWLSTTTAPIDLPVQTTWYEAACQAARTQGVAGIYWWEVNFDADPARPGMWQSDRLTFLGRPAQEVIRSCFAALAG